MTHDLAYWKGRIFDAQDAFRRNKTREYLCAIRFAQRKVRDLERITFEGSRYEYN